MKRYNYSDVTFRNAVHNLLTKLFTQYHKPGIRLTAHNINALQNLYPSLPKNMFRYLPASHLLTRYNGRRYAEYSVNAFTICPEAVDTFIEQYRKYEYRRTHGGREKSPTSVRIKKLSPVNSIPQEVATVVSREKITPKLVNTQIKYEWGECEIIINSARVNDKIHQTIDILYKGEVVMNELTSIKQIESEIATLNTIKGALVFIKELMVAAN